MESTGTFGGYLIESPEGQPAFDYQMGPPEWVVPVEELVFPADGRAEITYFRNVFDPWRSPRLSLYIQSDPWRLTGIPPFAWTYLHPAGEQRFPILRLALARRARAYQENRRTGTWAERVPLGSSIDDVGAPNVFLLEEGNPRVEVIRPQIESLIPGPGEPFELHQVVGMPRIEGPDPFRNRGYFDTTVKISPYDRGVLIEHIEGKYSVDIRIKRLGQPAAFAYEIVHGAEIKEVGFHLGVVHNSNVEIKLVIHETFPFVNVYAARLGGVDAVPQQGTVIRDRNYPFRPVEPYQIILRPETMIAVAAIETAISMIPFVGVLYDIGQLAYMHATGKTFWGQRFSEDDAVLMGAMLLLPLAVGTASTLSQVRRFVKSRKLRRVFEAETIRRIRDASDTAFLEAVGTL